LREIASRKRNDSCFDEFVTVVNSDFTHNLVVGAIFFHHIQPVCPITDSIAARCDNIPQKGLCRSLPVNQDGSEAVRRQVLLAL